MNDKLEDIEATVKKAVENFRAELNKIDVDAADYAFTIAKIDGGVSVSALIKINITKK